MSGILSARGLRKEYPSFTLDDVTFDLAPGKITGLIGRNGAGKSTTLKCLMNYVHPTAGEVRFFGEPFETQERMIKQRTGFVTGSFAYYQKKKLSAITEVTRGFFPNWDDEAYRRYLEKFELDESKTPAQLSEGMRVKYAVALALSHRAELLLLDEPTSGLDPVSRDELTDLFLALRGAGTTILFSTHITSDLEKCADDLLYIRKGRLAACEPVDCFLARWRMVSLTQEQADAGLGAKLIGCGPIRNGWRGLCPADAELPACLTAEPASLDEIIVHLEKEESECARF